MFFLLMLSPGARGPAAETRTRGAPAADDERGQPRAGVHCPAGRLGNPGSCGAEKARSREKGKTKRQSRSAIFRAGARPPNPRIITAPAGNAPRLFLFVDYCPPRRAG